MKRALPVHVLTAFLLATVGVAAAEDGYLVYAGSDTDAPSHSKGIYAWRFEPSSGSVTPLGLVAETVNPAYVCATPDGRFLYAVKGQPPGAAKVYPVRANAIEKKTGSLTFLNPVSAGGGLPNQVIV